jgi:signal peptidase I
LASRFLRWLAGRLKQKFAAKGRRASICACAGRALRRNFPGVTVWLQRAPRMQTDISQTRQRSWWRTIIIGRNPRRTLIRIVVIVVTFCLLRAFVVVPIRVTGPSMLPTYRARGINVVNRLAYLRHEPRRGDVVAIRLAGESIMLMKRVIGLPGETVEFANGRLLINGRYQDEPYVKFQCNWNFVPERSKLGEDEYYVVGDNRSMPHADHEQGAARRARIVGKVLL